MKEGLQVDITLEFGAFKRSVSFEAPPGITALIGPSGSGKTTTLNCIAGLAQPKSGFISFNDETWFDSSKAINVKPQARHPGYVFQSVALFPHLTVSENIVFGLSDLPVNEKQLRLAALAKQISIEELLPRRPAQLSGGQSQRVAIARALAAKPRILLLDEPINALDKLSRQKVADELRGIQKQEGSTILFVTHFLDESRSFADFVIDLGEICTENRV